MSAAARTDGAPAPKRARTSALSADIKENEAQPSADAAAEELGAEDWARLAQDAETESVPVRRDLYLDTVRALSDADQPQPARF